MPLRFSSQKGTSAGYEVGTPLFECWVNPTSNRFCKRCIARKGQTRTNLSLTGSRCKKTSCYISDFCSIHLKTVLNLQLKNSQFGKGLYAYGPSYGPEPIFNAARTHIAYYGGERMSKLALDERYDYLSASADLVEPTAPYAGTINSAMVIDAACNRKSGCYANSPEGVVGSVANAELEFSNHNSRVLLAPGSEIFHGDEILVLYNDEFWEGFGPTFMSHDSKYKVR
jgi:hypothetical protein